MKYKLQTVHSLARVANLLSQKRASLNLLGFMLPLFVMLVFQTSLQAQTFPIPLTASSFNFDCVAEAAPPSQHTTSAMPGNDVIYSDTYPGVNGTGMPSSNVITDGTVTYNIQPYTGDNALQLIGLGTGDLTFQTPTALSVVHLACFSVFGSANIDVVATFLDGTTEQIGTNFTISDWFNGANVVHTLNGRTTFSGQVYNLNSGNPRIYTYVFNISPANQSKPITKITVNRVGGPMTSRPYFMGVAGSNPPVFNINVTADTLCSSENEWSVPINMDTSLNDIASIDLVLDYDTSKMTYSSVTGAASLNTATSPIAVVDNGGKLSISWSSTAGVTAGNETLMTLNFVPAGGASDFSAIAGQTTDFTWDVSIVGNCQITDVSSSIVFGNYVDQTGAVINVCNALTGNLIYYNNTQAPFNDATIIATGFGLQPDTFYTDPIDGSFQLDLLDGVTYELSYNTQDMHDGANATDALNVLLDSSNAIFLFSTYALAADVNTDMMIDGADASEIQSRFVSNSVTSYSGNKDWVFDLGVVTLFGSDLSGFDIHGLAMGDVNGSLYKANPVTTSVTDTFITVTNGDRIMFPVRLKQAENIGAMSLAINFPSSAMTVHDVLLSDNTSIMNEVDGDELRAAWASLDFQHLETNDILFYIDATIDDIAGYAASPITFSSETELADSMATVIPSVMLGLPDVFVTSTSTLEEAGMSLRNFPNPVSNQMTIEYDLSATSEVSIQVFNSLGQEITQLVNETQQAGMQQVIWNADKQAAGVYFYTIIVREGNHSYQTTKQVVILK